MYVVVRQFSPWPCNAVNREMTAVINTYRIHSMYIWNVNDAYIICIFFWSVHLLLPFTLARFFFRVKRHSLLIHQWKQLFKQKRKRLVSWHDKNCIITWLCSRVPYREHWPTHHTWFLPHRDSLLGNGQLFFQRQSSREIKIHTYGFCYFQR